jgi:hypothetical protein
MDKEAIGVLDPSPGARSIMDQKMQDMYGTGTKELYMGNDAMGVLGPSYGQRTAKDIAMQHMFGGDQKNVWDGSRENYTSFSGYENPYNPYSGVMKLAPLK